MTKFKIAYNEGAEPKERKFWPTIGSAWKTKSNGVSVTLGRQIKDKDGKLQESFEEITLQRGTRMYLKPNPKKSKTGSPDFFVVLPDDSEPTE
jgi:hypothetical protein